MNLPLVAAGDVVIAAFGVVVAAYEGWLFFQHQRKAVHSAAAAVAAATSVFAVAAAVQYSTVNPAHIQAIMRVEFVALIALALSVAGLATASTGRPHPVPPLVSRLLALLSGLLVVGTDLIVPSETVELNVWLLDHPYLQSRSGPLTLPFFAAFIGFAALSAGWMVWKARSHDARIFVGTAVSVWLVVAVVDAAVSAGLFTSTPLFVMEYGFFLLAGSVMAADLQHYGQLLRRSEELQVKSEESFRLLIERVPICTLLYVDDRVVYANPAALLALGYGRLEEILGVPASDLVHPEDLPGAEERIRQMVRTGQPAAVREERIRRRDGSWAPLEMAGVPVVFQERPAIAVIGMDVSERKNLTAKMMQMDRMIAVGTLAAGVAHEINNPLSYVVANIEFANEILPALAEAIRRASGAGAPTVDAAKSGARAVDVPKALEDLKRALADAREGGERVRRIVGDLRVFSRGEQNCQAPVAIPQVIESSISMAWSEIKHRARLVKDFGPVPLVMANESRLGQVFLNLLVNAAQAIPEGRTEANEIRVVTRTNESGGAVVEVRDTGCGIPAEIRGRVFDPFFTTKPVGQGTGLGLSICQGIVRDLGGEVRLDSEVGRGTTFYVTLPAAALAAPEAERAQPVPRVDALRRGRILVVDDEEALGSAIRRALSSEHDVVALTSARAALARLDAGETFDVIICDLMMPEVTGMEFFAEVGRSHPHLQEHIVFITGGVLNAQVHEFLDGLPNPRLEKPFEIGSLRAIVRAALR